ncbi:ATP-dependent DNA helicase PIF1-like [Dendronephthya gigantea]|uniref:ATP-dependent DNA helicase PIF1-like n=1 Tax=Dendronephthya gigantea TaxID=151771 RepID=UPI00106BBE2F|nr:ATP-dependent DNA helicase PIF1-like [Dendronephthya gigantea]
MTFIEECGGAGVGKSHLTKCLYQAALKYYNTREGDDFHQVKILMLAPTGKAAFNIKDEISMVGSAMFNVQINNRLKDIKGSNEDFGGVSMVVIGDLFQLEPVMDRYIFKNIDDSQYAVLAPNKWQDHFNMFELQEIMKQKDSKMFAEILNKLREGKQTEDDILKLKERLIRENSIQDPMDIPHLFIQNKKVNKFNERVHNAATVEKFSIKAIDSVIGANSAQLRDKILSQIPDDPRKTKQIVSNLQLSVGERTEIALNIRTDDGMTNGAGNVVKKIQLNEKDKPSDNDSMYDIDGYTLFRNDGHSFTTRPFGD